MRGPRRLLLLVAAAALAYDASLVRADVASGPAVGEAVPALKVYATTGTQAAKEVDFPADRAKKPTVYCFVRGDQWSRPMARFLKTLDGSLKKKDETAAVVAVWLTEDVEGMKAHLPRVDQSLKFEATTLAVYEKDKQGPAAWGINSDAHLTAVVVRNGSVAKTFGFVSVNETVVGDVEAALKDEAR